MSTLGHLTYIGAALDLLTIVIFAIAAAALVLRLRSVLGRRTGHEQRPPQQRDRGGPSDHGDENIIDMPSRGPDRQPGSQATDDLEPETETETELGATIAMIEQVDTGFDLVSFTEGAQAAFALIIESYAGGDKETLHGLLSEDVYQNFAGAIQARQEKKETLETSLIGLLKTDIIEARLDGKTAYITVKLVSEQINVTRDSEDRVIDGDPSQVSTVTDIWTFSHDVKSRNPNWILVATDSSN